MTQADKPQSKFKLYLKKAFRFAWKAALGFFIFTFLWVLLYKWVNPPITAIMIKRKMEARAAGEPAGLSREWVRYSNISSNMPLALIASEDQNFLKHNGFDFQAIDDAMEYNEKQAKRGRKKRRGASTISQQVAKNVFLWENRSWVRKGFEVYFTFMVELLWSKRRILEVYMNVAETGNMTFGVQAAAKRYFKTTAGKLSIEQAALIAVTLPSPRKYKPNNPGSYLVRRKNWVVRQSRNVGGVGILKDI